MLVIRKIQHDLMETAQKKNYVFLMQAHLEEFFPVDCKVLGRPQIRRIIRVGMHRSGHHGFETQGAVCRYLTLMFMLGSYFDIDPQTDWAGGILRRDEPASVRMGRLYDRAMAYVQRIAGDDGQHYRRMMIRAYEMLDASLPKTGSGKLAADAMAFGQRLYPQKHHAIGKNGWRRLLKSASAAAPRHGCQGREGFILYAALAFVLGVHFARDPIFPWAATALADSGGDAAVLQRDIRRALASYLQATRTIS